jgi:hypothetical protein
MQNGNQRNNVICNNELKASKSKNKIIRNTSNQEPDKASKFEEFLEKK